MYVQYLILRFASNNSFISLLVHTGMVEGSTKCTRMRLVTSYSTESLPSGFIHTSKKIKIKWRNLCTFLQLLSTSSTITEMDNLQPYFLYYYVFRKCYCADITLETNKYNDLDTTFTGAFLEVLAIRENSQRSLHTRASHVSNKCP